MPLTNTQLTLYLDRQDYTETSTHYITTCPTCKHHNNKLYIDKETLTYNCFHCGDTKQKDFDTVQEREEVHYDYLTPKYVEYVTSSLSYDALSYLKDVRNLSDDTIAAFKLGYDSHIDAIVIPQFHKDKVVNVIHRFLSGPLRYKSHGKKHGFGIYQEVTDTSACIVFEGELNAISSYQLMPGLTAVATGGKNVKSKKLLEFLSQFDDIYIWFDDDGDEEAEKLAESLGKWRCHKIECEEGDLNDLLKDDDALSKYVTMVRDASRYEKPLVVDVSDLTERCLDSIYNKKYQSRSTGFAALDGVTGGFRPGEIYMLTGDSGVGKSTLAARLLYSMIKQDVPSLVCSLENPAESHVLPALLSFILHRNIRLDPKPEPELIKNALLELDKSKLVKIVDRATRSTPNQIKMYLDTGAKLGYKFIVVDHLQFFLGQEEREVNEVIANVVDFINQNKEVTILLLAHTRKPGRDYKTGLQRYLTIHDLKGSSKIYQEPGNIMILNRRHSTDEVFLTVGKIDRAGHTNIKPGGKVNLFFDKETFDYNITSMGY